jgi:hypothetical protein
MFPYVLATIAMLVVAALAYSLGYDKGNKNGIDQVLNEDLARLEEGNVCMDHQMVNMVDNLVKDVETYQEQNALVHSIVEEVNPS